MAIKKKQQILLRKVSSWVESTSPIEQQLDMMEDGPMRGDTISHAHGVDRIDPMETNYNYDMSEEGREGDEMSGDDHSSGLQGGGTEAGNARVSRKMDGEMPGVDAELDPGPDSIDPEELDRTG